MSALSLLKRVKESLVMLKHQNNNLNASYLFRIGRIGMLQILLKKELMREENTGNN